MNSLPLEPVQLKTRMSFGIGCPPGAEHCYFHGNPDPNSGTVHAQAILYNSNKKPISEVFYEITEEFLLYVEKQIPDGLLSWLPHSTGGTMSQSSIKQQTQERFQHLIQVYFCNHAYAQLVLNQLTSDEPLHINCYSKDIATIFKDDNSMPSEADFLTRAQKIVKMGHAKYLLDLGSTHIALYYGITHEAALAFLSLLRKQEYITEGLKRTGFTIPYGTGNCENYESGIELTKVGITYKSIQTIVPRAFIAMPFSGLDTTFSVITSAWKQVYEDAPLIRQDFDPDKGGARLIDEKILTNIEKSSLVIVDLSLGTKEANALAVIEDTELLKSFVPLNPNVMFEAGYALRCVSDETSSCRDILFLAKSPAHEHVLHRVFDLRNRNVIKYDDSTEDGIKKLHAELFEFFTHLSKN